MLDSQVMVFIEEDGSFPFSDFLILQNSKPSFGNFFISQFQHDGPGVEEDWDLIFNQLLKNFLPTYSTLQNSTALSSLCQNGFSHFCVRVFQLRQVSLADGKWEELLGIIRPAET
jgi:hypothetical protein